MNTDQILQSGFSAEERAYRQQAEKLESDSLCNIIEEKYIQCTSPSDNDYEIAQIEGCDATIKIDDDEDQVIECECGRLIDLDDKNPKSRFRVDSHENELVDYCRETISSHLNTTRGRKKSLTYLEHKFENVIEMDVSGEVGSEIYIDEIVEIHFCLTTIDSAVVDSIKQHNRPALIILIGDGTLSQNHFRNSSIPYLTFGYLYQEKEENLQESIEEAIQISLNSDPLSQIADRCDAACRLYTEHRDRIDDRDYEHIVNTLLNGCFGTSKLLGTKLSGKQFPDGIFSIDLPDSSYCYLWDAKYSKPAKEPHRLSSSVRENMSKYPVRFKRQSNVLDTFGDIAGFIIFSPHVKDEDIVSLAQRFYRRFQDDGDVGGLTVVHFRTESLMRLYELYHENQEDLKRKPRQLRNHFQNLLQRSNYHNNKDEYEDIPKELTVFDVSTEEIEELVFEVMSTQPVENKEIDFEAYRSNVEKIEFE